VHLDEEGVEICASQEDIGQALPIMYSVVVWYLTIALHGVTIQKTST